MYRAADGDGVVRISDEKFIARDNTSQEWMDYLAWQNAGGLLEPALPVAPVWEWFIDIGPFFDRFGAAKMAVLTSSHPVAKAVVTDCMVRKWIDLKNASVGQGIDALMLAQVPGVTAELKDAILNTPVQDIERSAAVKLYFTN